MPGPKVLLAMSGGVDSSVAAVLLLRAGYEVVGCFMRLGSPGEELEGLVDPDASCRVANGNAKVSLKVGHQGCCSINDAADARLVAAKLNIPFYVCNFKKDFGRIIDYFVAEYDAGRTPNPCVRCNDWLKFGKLHDYALSIDAEFVASGHYARIERDADGNAELWRGVDRDKDQSYVLFGAKRDRLAHMLLPIGGYAKSEVRRIAREAELPVFDKPDSQEICFVPDNDYAGLVARRSPESMRPGLIVDRNGRTLGEHQGHQHFTVGQRRGLGIGGLAGGGLAGGGLAGGGPSQGDGRPLYVVSKDAVSNTVVVGERHDLLREGCLAREANWLGEPQPDADGFTRCEVAIRYNASPVPGRVRGEHDRLEIHFDEPQTAVAPGQAAVCYTGERVLCGGWIEQSL